MLRARWVDAAGDHGYPFDLSSSVSRGSDLDAVLGRLRFDDPSRLEHGLEAVPLETLDRYCRTAGVTSIALLKIDVEGSELEVLRGADGLLGRKAIDAVQFEYGGQRAEDFRHASWVALAPHVDATRFGVVDQAARSA